MSSLWLLKAFSLFVIVSKYVPCDCRHVHLATSAALRLVALLNTARSLDEPIRRNIVPVAVSYSVRGCLLQLPCSMFLQPPMPNYCSVISPAEVYPTRDSVLLMTNTRCNTVQTWDCQKKQAQYPWIFPPPQLRTKVHTSPWPFHHCRTSYRKSRLRFSNSWSRM